MCIHEMYTHGASRQCLFMIDYGKVDSWYITVKQIHAMCIQGTLRQCLFMIHYGKRIQWTLRQSVFMYV